MNTYWKMILVFWAMTILGLLITSLPFIEVMTISGFMTVFMYIDDARKRVDFEQKIKDFEEEVSDLKKRNNERLRDLFEKDKL